MTEERDKMLLLLKNKIVNGDFNYDYGDEWYTEDATFYKIDDNPVLEDAIVVYEYSGGSRNWQGDDHWDYWDEKGDATLGELLDFLLNRKFGNDGMKEKHEDIIKFLKMGDYNLSAGIDTIDVGNWQW